jgi:hypothetical protein
LFVFSVFELLERGEVLVVPTDTPLEEQETWLAFRDVILGLEYREFLVICSLFICGFAYSQL